MNGKKKGGGLGSGPSTPFSFIFQNSPASSPVDLLIELLDTRLPPESVSNLLVQSELAEFIDLALKQSAEQESTSVAAPPPSSKAQTTGAPPSSSRVQTTGAPPSSSRVQTTGAPPSSSWVQTTGAPPSSSRTQSTGVVQTAGVVQTTGVDKRPVKRPYEPDYLPHPVPDKPFIFKVTMIDKRGFIYGNVVEEQGVL